MTETSKQKKTYMVIGMLLASSFTFILLLLKPLFPGLLEYGYLKILVIWIWLLLIYLYATKAEKQKLLLWSDKRQTFLFYLISVIAVLGLSFLAGASQQLLPKLGFKVQTSPLLKEMLAYMQAHPLVLILTCITAGVVEELIFRGYLIPRLNILFKNGYLAVILSALIFALAHMGYGTFVNMLVPFLIGLIFGAYYQKYRNLKVLILCHFLIDLLSLTTNK